MVVAALVGVELREDGEFGGFDMAEEFGLKGVGFTLDLLPDIPEIPFYRPYSSLPLPPHHHLPHQPFILPLPTHRIHIHPLQLATATFDPTCELPADFRDGYERLLMGEVSGAAAVWAEVRVGTAAEVQAEMGEVLGGVVGAVVGTDVCWGVVEHFF